MAPSLKGSTALLERAAFGLALFLYFWCSGLKFGQNNRKVFCFEPFAVSCHNNHQRLTTIACGPSETDPKSHFFWRCGVKSIPGGNHTCTLTDISALCCSLSEMASEILLGKFDVEGLNHERNPAKTEYQDLLLSASHSILQHLTLVAGWFCQWVTRWY